MSIPYNPSSPAMIPDPSLGSDHTRRIVLNPPLSFIQSVAAQAAIAAGQAAPPQANGPIAFGQDGQAVLMPPSSSSNFPSVAGGTNAGTSTGTGQGGSSSAMGMGVNTPDQQGLDPAVMQAIQSQLVNGPASPSLSPSIASAVSQNPPASTPTISSSPTTATSADPSASASALISSIASTSIDPSSSMASSSSLSTSPSASASATASASASTDPSRPFTQSPAFILLIVFSALIFFGVIATALSWLLRWKGKDGSRSFFGAGCCGGKRRRNSDRNNHDRDLEADNLSDIIRNFESRRGSYGTTASSLGHNEYANYDPGMEKRSSLLAEEMGRVGKAPFLHSGTAGLAAAAAGRTAEDGMEDIDLDADGSLGPLPRMPAAREMHEEDGIGSPRMMDHFGTGRLEVRNGDTPASAGSGYGDRSRTVPAGRSWSAERGLSNLGNGWMSKSNASLPSSSASSLPSPFTNRSRNGSTDNIDIVTNASSSSSTAVSRSQSVKSLNKWDRTQSHMTDMSLTSHHSDEGEGGAESPLRSSSWASNLRSSLLAAISGPRRTTAGENDKFTRPVLPVHLSRSSTLRSGLSRSTSMSSVGSGRRPLGPCSTTFGPAAGRGLVITEEEDEVADDKDEVYSLASSAKRDMETALLGAEGVSRSSSATSSGSTGLGPSHSGRRVLRINRVGAAAGAVGDRWKLNVKPSRFGGNRMDDEVDALPLRHAGDVV